MLRLIILVRLGLWVLLTVSAAYLARKLGLKYYKAPQTNRLLSN